MKASHEVNSLELNSPFQKQNHAIKLHQLTNLNSELNPSELNSTNETYRPKF
jgi:hypothetical protein